MLGKASEPAEPAEPSEADGADEASEVDAADAACAAGETCYSFRLEPSPTNNPQKSTKALAMKTVLILDTTMVWCPLLLLRQI